MNHYPSVPPLIQNVLNCSTTLHVRLGIVLKNTTGAMTDLDEAISMLRESLSLGPRSHRLLALINLAYYLETRFKENGSQSDFEEATSLRQEILAISK